MRGAQPLVAGGERTVIRGSRTQSGALRPGTLTRVFAYNGTVPGPTLELREGDSVVIHFRNELAEPSTIHWHGLSLPFVADGSPFHPVPPGGTHDYVFRVRPGTAGTYWYHPHPDHRTGHQVAMGLYGAVVVHADDDPLRALRERVLLLSDGRLTADGAIDLPDHESPITWIAYGAVRRSSAHSSRNVVSAWWKSSSGGASGRTT